MTLIISIGLLLAYAWGNNVSDAVIIASALFGIAWGIENSKK